MSNHCRKFPYVDITVQSSLPFGPITDHIMQVWQNDRFKKKTLLKTNTLNSKHTLIFWQSWQLNWQCMLQLIVHAIFHVCSSNFAYIGINNDQTYMYMYLVSHILGSVSQTYAWHPFFSRIGTTDAIEGIFPIFPFCLSE